MPPVAGTSPSSVRPSVVLPDAGLADQARAPRRARRSKLTPSTAFTEPASRPRSRSTKRAAQREVDLQVADLEQRVACRPPALQASSATAISSRSSGSVPPGGICVRRAVQPAARRAAPPAARDLDRVLRSAQTCIASGQRGWKRQPGGGSIEVRRRAGDVVAARSCAARSSSAAARACTGARARRTPRARRPPRRSARRT